MTRANGRTSQSLVISLIIHGLILLILGAYLISKTEPFQDYIDAAFLAAPSPPKPAVRKPVVKPVIKPSVPAQPAVAVEEPQLTPRLPSPVAVKTHRSTPSNAVQLSSRRLKPTSLPNPHRPKIVNPNEPIPRVVTHVDLPASDAPGTPAFSGPSAGAAANGAGQTRRGISGRQVGVQLSSRTQGVTSGIASLLQFTDAVPSALDALVGEMHLGSQLMIPMRPNQLGARIYTDPQTGLPTGYLQICYVRFRQAGMNPLFRVDPSALYFLLEWMSGNTRIKAQLAGRTLFLDDPGILESPMLYMNGEKAVRFRRREKQNLTRYLVEKGGFIFVDDDHSRGSLSTKAFANSMRAQFREIILGAGGRELQRIPNDHPIWNQPFPLGGQPAEPNRTGLTWPMAAFALNGRLSVVISYNDYNNGWEAPGAASVSYVPPVLRMGANFMFYAATHGIISDYRHYVPPNRWREDDILLPRRAPQAATIPATGFERR